MPKVAHRKDISLTGIADILRKEYGVPDNRAILTFSEVPTRTSKPGGYDVSWSISEEERVRRLEERAESRERGRGVVRSGRAKKRARLERKRRSQTP